MNYLTHDTKDHDVEVAVKNFINYLKNPLFEHKIADIADHLRNVLKNFKHAEVKWNQQ